MKQTKIITESKPVTVTQEVKTGVVIELTNEEAQIILNRFNCSSFKTYDEYRKEQNIPHYSRSDFAAKLAAILN
jgi:hypothetical protein